MDFQTHQPFLKMYIEKTKGDILEFGTGDGSTGFILDLIKGTDRKLISIENNENWLNKMKSLYPENEQHKYHFVLDWESFIKQMKPEKYSIVFIDQSPWEARIMSLNHFKDVAEYIIIHDADYFPTNKLFGSVIPNKKFEDSFNFDDVFKNWKLYFPEKPYPYYTGPPTLVGSNTGNSIV